MRKLEPGEQKLVSTSKRIHVTAVLVDQDAPFVKLQFGSAFAIHLSDYDAERLMEDIKTALRLLPPSK